jgi:glyoxylase-like metal-dependent hydrolase (beta-lactamase superfamily II)
VTIEEQPADWTEPGAYKVVPGVHRVPLPIPAAGLHAVNVYVVEDRDGLVIIDSGWAMPDSETKLKAALALLGHEVEDIVQILVTHAHWDHYGQALALRQAFGTRVRIGRGEQVSIEAIDPAAGMHPAQVKLLRRCGAGELADRIAAANPPQRFTEITNLLPDSWLDHGERVGLGERGLDIFETPGHTRGHVVLRDAAAGLLFAGDHVLPHISPSLALEPVPEPKPLRSYLASLELVRGMADTLLLPAHGPVTPSVHTRIEELVKHHEERLDIAAKQVRSGAATAYEVARAMKWTRRERKLEDLEEFSQMLAILEIEAHLDVLADQGVVVAEEHGGVRTYTAA